MGRKCAICGKPTYYNMAEHRDCIQLEDWREELERRRAEHERLNRGQRELIEMVMETARQSNWISK